MSFDPVVMDEWRYNSGKEQIAQDLAEAKARDWLECETAEADEVVHDCMFSDDMPTEIGYLLLELHKTRPEKLLGSDVLADLYRLAKKVDADVFEKLTEIALDELMREVE